MSSRIVRLQQAPRFARWRGWRWPFADSALSSRTALLGS